MKQTVPVTPNYPVKDADVCKRVPHNIEAEQALLGAILINNDVLSIVTDLLEPGDFYDPLHGRIYKACARLIHSDQKATSVTLRTYFESEEPVGSLTVPQYLGRLVANAVGTFSVKSYAETIKRLSSLRSLILIGDDLANSSYDANIEVDVGDIIDDIEERLFKLQYGKQIGHRQLSIANAVREAIENLQDPNDNNLIPSGLKGINDKIGGYRKGYFIVLAGRPSMGKSALAQSESLKLARAGRGNAYFSLEMTHEEIAQRDIADMLYSGENSLTYAEIANKAVSEHHFHRILNAEKEFKSLPLVIDDKRGITAHQLVAKARQIARTMERRGNVLEVLFVDHIGLLKASSEYRGNKTNEMGEISNALATMAKDLNVCVVGLHQLNREVEKRADKRPTLADLRDSGNIEQDAHIVIFVYRGVYYLEKVKYDDHDKEIARLDLIEKMKNEMEVIIAKQRNGECGTVYVNAFMGSNAIRNKVA